jgi:hypothetical protein
MDFSCGGDRCRWINCSTMRDIGMRGRSRPWPSFHTFRVTPRRARSCKRSLPNTSGWQGTPNNGRAMRYVTISEPHRPSASERTRAHDCVSHKALGLTMTSRTFATLFALTALAAVALPTSAQANCTASSGTSVPTGGTQPCTPPSTGSGMICKSDGKWDNSACTVGVAPPPPTPCGSRDQGVTNACPSGTTCQPMRIAPPTPRPFYCFFWALPFNPIPPIAACRDHPLQTVDWFCLP